MTEVIATNNNWDGENVPTVFIDFLGQEIRVGDHVAYATSSNHSANLTLAEVLEFKTTDGKGKPLGWNHEDREAEPLSENKYGYKTYPYRFQPQWKFKVQPLADMNKWYGRRGSDARQVTLNLLNVIKVDSSNADFEAPD